MTCPHCQGSSVVSASAEDVIGANEWMRCVNCGHRWDADPPELKGSDMPGPWTEERRAKFQATMAAKRGESGARAVSVSKPRPSIEVVIPPRMTDLDHAIERTRNDLDTLERAKEILARA